MKKREPVTRIMTEHVLSIEEHQPLTEAVKVFKAKNIRHLPVTNGKKISGILSSNDINRLTFGALFDGQEGTDEVILQMLSIPQVMSAHPVTISPETSVREVAEIFSVGQFHALPVVENDELKGIVTTTDVIKYLLDQY